MDLAMYRRFYAEEIEATSALETPGLVDAFATVPRELFLPPGPSMLKGVMAALRCTRPDSASRPGGPGASTLSVRGWSCGTGC